MSGLLGASIDCIQVLGASIDCMSQFTMYTGVRSQYRMNKGVRSMYIMYTGVRSHYGEYTCASIECIQLIEASVEYAGIRSQYRVNTGAGMPISGGHPKILERGFLKNVNFRTEQPSVHVIYHQFFTKQF